MSRRLLSPILWLALLPGTLGSPRFSGFPSHCQAELGSEGPRVLASRASKAAVEVSSSRECSGGSSTWHPCGLKEQVVSTRSCSLLWGQTCVLAHPEDVLHASRTWA